MATQDSLEVRGTQPYRSCAFKRRPRCFDRINGEHKSTYRCFAFCAQLLVRRTSIRIKSRISMYTSKVRACDRATLSPCERLHPRAQCSLKEAESSIA
eukprot:7087584-Pyramimonas_sp.AAC.1